MHTLESGLGDQISPQATPPFKHWLIVKPLTPILSGHMINRQLEGISNICHAHYRAQEVGALTLEASICLVSFLPFS